MTAPSARVSNMIHKLDISVGFIPLGLSVYVSETSDSFALMWFSTRIQSRLVIFVIDVE